MVAVCLGLEPVVWMKLCCRFPTVKQNKDMCAVESRLHVFVTKLHLVWIHKVHLSIYCKCCPIKLLLASQCVEHFTPSVHSNAIIYSSVLNNSQMPFHHLAIAFSLCSFLVLNLYSWPFTRLKLRWEHERNSVWHLHATIPANCNLVHEGNISSRLKKIIIIMNILPRTLCFNRCWHALNGIFYQGWTKRF